MRILLIPWVAPIAILMWLFYILPFWLFGWIKYKGKVTPLVFRFDTNTNWLSGWTGTSAPFAVIINQKYGPIETAKTVNHEVRHTDQWLVLGVFFLPLFFIPIMFYGYEDNPLEVDARNQEE